MLRFPLRSVRGAQIGRAARWLLVWAVLATLFPPLPLGTSRAAVGVGLGSYTTTLPAGARTPSDSAGQPVAPARTANVTGATPTNSWWSSLVWRRHGAANPYSENLYPHPLALRAQAGGLGVSYPTTPTISHGSPAYLGEYHHSYAQDLLLGVAGLNAPETRVDGYTDWTVTALWTVGTRSLRATFGHGLPYVYATKTGGDALVAFSGTPTIWRNGGSVVGVTVNGHHYGLFAPTGATWSGSGPLQSTLAGKDYFSVAVLPDNTPATFDYYAEHAYAFVTGATVSWSYDPTAGQVTTTFAAATTPKEGGETRPLLALYRHQWLHTAAPLTTYSYVSPRGAMKVLAGGAFTTSLPFSGVLPALPDAGGADRTVLYGQVDDFYTTNRTNYFQGPTDTYWTGKALGRLAALVRIADQVGHTVARDSFLAALQSKLQDWLQAPDGKAASLFYHDSTWGRVETYRYFATNDLAGWERYDEGQGLLGASGSFANLNGGTVRLEIWNAIGQQSVSLRTDATATDGLQSTLSLPFTGLR